GGCFAARRSGPRTERFRTFDPPLNRLEVFWGWLHGRGLRSPDRSPATPAEFHALRPLLNRARRPSLPAGSPADAEDRDLPGGGEPRLLSFPCLPSFHRLTKAVAFTIHLTNVAAMRQPIQ